MPRNRVLLKGQGVPKEGEAGGTISPGHLVVRNTSDAIVVHPTAGGNVLPAFAREDDLQGNDLNDDYLITENVLYNVMWPGEEVSALLAIGNTIVIGDPLESAGDGTLQLHVPPDVEASGAINILQVKPIVGFALEAIDTAPSGSVVTRIEIEVA